MLVTFKHIFSACDAIFSMWCERCNIRHVAMEKKWCVPATNNTTKMQYTHNMHSLASRMHPWHLSNAWKLCQMQHFSFSIWLDIAIYYVCTNYGNLWYINNCIWGAKYSEEVYIWWRYVQQWHHCRLSTYLCWGGGGGATTTRSHFLLFVCKIYVMCEKWNLNVFH